MMGRQTGDQSQLFYLFNLEELIPAGHLLRRINPVVTRVLAELRENLTPFYSDIGRPSIDPELMLRMLIVGYCYGIRFERRLCEEVELHLAYRWFCRLDLDDQVPDHSTFSVNRHGRFRNSAIFRKLFEAVVRACMSAGLVKGEGFAVDASVMEADASRYHGQAPGETDWSAPERQTRAVAEFLSSLDDEGSDADRKLPKVISPTDPCSAWTAKANKRVQFGYGLNYMIDLEHAVIVDVEATPARTYDEVAATRTMIDRTEMAFGLKPARLTADTAYGTGKLLAWLLDRDITPHIPVWDRYQRTDGMFSHLDFTYDNARDVVGGLVLPPSSPLSLERFWPATPKSGRLVRSFGAPSKPPARSATSATRTFHNAASRRHGGDDRAACRPWRQSAPGSPAEFGKLTADETEKWAKVVKFADI